MIRLVDVVRIYLAAILTACHTPPPLPAMRAIATIPPLELPDPKTEHDCRPSPILRKTFAHAFFGSVLRPCGTLQRSATPDQIAAARRCVVASIEHGDPFLIEQQLPDSDGVVARATLGAVESGELHIYRVDYDEPTCSGDCPKIRNSRISRCHGAALQACSNDVAACVQCDREEEFSSCASFSERPGR